MKKTVLLLLCLLLCVCLAACEKCEHQWKDASCEVPMSCPLCDATQGTVAGHQWQEATCLTPKTCAVCGATEGSVTNDHLWQDATCKAPKTCSRCNLKEGEPLEHELMDPNYHDPKTCKNCDYTEGEPLPPLYATFPVNVINAQVDTVYDYKTACYLKGHETVGKLTLENYQVFTSDETHEAVDGYEWHRVTVKIVFSDNDAVKYGFTVKSAVDDYFCGLPEDGNGYTDQFTANFHGQVYDQCLMANSQGVYSEWVDSACTYTAEYAWRVPKGYDGFLIMFYNGNKSAGDCLTKGDDTMLIFRFAA